MRKILDRYDVWCYATSYNVALRDVLDIKWTVEVGKRWAFRQGMATSTERFEEAP